MAIYKDTVYTVTFQVTSAGVAQDITGWTFASSFRVNVSDTTSLLDATSASGAYTITGAATGRFQLRLLKAQTDLLPVGRVVFDIMRTDASPNPVRLCGCRTKVKQAVTRL